MDCENAQQWKAILPANCADGVIFENQHLALSAKISLTKFLGRVLLTFEGRGGSTITSIQNTLSQTEGLDMQISNVKYPAPGSGGHPQAMLLVMLNNPVSVCPTLQFSYIAGGVQDGNVTVRLPIFLNRFMEPVEMPLANFRSVWNDITTKRPDSF